MAFPFRNLFGKTEDGLPHPDVPHASAGNAPVATAGDAAGLPFSPAPPAPAVAARTGAEGDSPFQATRSTSQRAYTFETGELMRSIPGHLVSRATLPQQQITLHLPPTAEDPVRQTLSTTLGKIYKACPQMFSQPIVETNDAAVRLSLAPAAAPGERTAQPKAEPPELPAQVAAQPQPVMAAPTLPPEPQASGVNQADSPFMVVNNGASPVAAPNQAAASLQTGPPAVPAGPPTPAPAPTPAPSSALPEITDSPFQVVNRNQGGGATTGSEPVEAAQSLSSASFDPVPQARTQPAPGAGSDSGGPFAQVGDSTPTPALAEEPEAVETPIPPQNFQPAAPQQLEAQAQPDSETAPSRAIMPNGEPALIFSLPQLLMRLDADALGIEPTTVPLSGQIQVPLSLVKPQLTTGRVSLSVAQLMQYSDQISKPILSAANPGVQVTLPLKDVFRQLPADVLQSRQRPAQPQEDSDIETPFSEGARQDAEQSVDVAVAKQVEARQKEPETDAEAVIQPETVPKAEEPTAEEEDDAAALMKAFLAEQSASAGREEEPTAEAVEAEPPAIEVETEDFAEEAPVPAITPAADLAGDDEEEIHPFPDGFLQEAPDLADSADGEIESLDDLGAPVEASNEQPEVEVAATEEEGSPDDGYGDMIVVEDEEDEQEEVAAEAAEIVADEVGEPAEAAVVAEPESPAEEAADAAVEAQEAPVEAEPEAAIEEPVASTHEEEAVEPAELEVEPKVAAVEAEEVAEPVQQPVPVPVVAETPAPAPAVAPAAQPAVSVAIAASDPPAPAPGAKPAGSHGFGGLDFQGPLRDLELRAVFGTEDDFAPQRIAELSSGLTGIAGCVIFDRQGRVFGEQLPPEQNEANLAEMMLRVYERVRGLASDLGFADSEAFTLHTSQGILSFYGEGDLCLSVLHETAEFPAGTAEKLALILHGTAKLLAAGPSS